MRNAIIRKPGPAPDPEKVKSVLAAVQDLLGMLDYYSGASQLGAVNIRGDVHSAWLRPYTPKPPG
jgi:hypothetical protein